MLTVVLGISYRALNISDVENKCMDKRGKDGGGMNGRLGLTYIHY